MASAPSPDPLGHQLLAERLASLPGLLRGCVEAGVTALSPRTHASRHFVVVGTGSSEAHARFLVHALNRHTTYSAEFTPLSAFLGSDPESRRGRTLVVFSQGLSPNARTAFSRRGEFAHTVVFTSVTEEGARRGGKLDRLQLLDALVSEGAEIVRFPVEDEYTTLIRIVGPACAYLACWSFVATLGGSRLRMPSTREIDLVVSSRPPAGLREDFTRHVAEFRRGFYMVASSPLCEYAQNLGYKFMEGLFWSAPILWDYLQFAHGPFQEVSLNPRPVLLIRTQTESDAEIADRADHMLGQVGLKAITLPLKTQGLLAILEAEMVLNHLLLDLIRDQSIDQVNWPSKGKDDPLYGFFRA